MAPMALCAKGMPHGCFPEPFMFLEQPISLSIRKKCIKACTAGPECTGACTLEAGADPHCCFPVTSYRRLLTKALCDLLRALSPSAPYANVILAPLWVIAVSSRLRLEIIGLECGCPWPSDSCSRGPFTAAVTNASGACYSPVQSLKEAIRTAHIGWAMHSHLHLI